MMKMMMIGEKGYPLWEKKVGTPMKNQRGDKKSDYQLNIPFKNP
jgi:hypothetical protein